MANMPIIVDPLLKLAINRNSWICTSRQPMTKIDALEQTVSFRKLENRKFITVPTFNINLYTTKGF